MTSQKYAFLYALILTFIVFNFGIFMGYMLESSRLDKINNIYLESEMQLLDERIQSEALDFMELDCNILVEENIKFGDDIYEDAKIINRYEDANRMSEEINFQHKRLDLLRTLFWVNSIKIRKKCGSNYHNVVYFYKYNNPTIEQKSEQKFFSNLLYELKEKFGDKIMLIPLAGDNDISAINLLMKKYNITEFPSILIDEKVVITEVESMEEIEQYLD